MEAQPGSASTRNGYEDTRSHSERSRSIGLDRQPGERDQIGDIAAIERQIENALGLNDLANSGTSRFDLPLFAC